MILSIHFESMHFVSVALLFGFGKTLHLFRFILTGKKKVRIDGALNVDVATPLKLGGQACMSCAPTVPLADVDLYSGFLFRRDLRLLKSQGFCRIEK